MTNYTNFAKTFSNSRKNLRWKEIEYIIQEYHPFLNERKILDVGCGNGRLLSHIVESGLVHNLEYHGLDGSSGMIEEAKLMQPSHQFHTHDMRHLHSFHEGDFDAAFFIASFHHLESIEDRDATLQGLKKILKPGSHIFMTNWALNSPENYETYKECLIENSRNEFGSEDYYVKIGEYCRFYHSFSHNELKYLFEKNGFYLHQQELFLGGRNLLSILQYRG